MKIGIDFDDVIADSMQVLVDLHNEQYGTHYKKEEALNPRAHINWPGSKEEWSEKISEFFSTKNLARLNPIAGAIPGIRELQAHGHELYIVTGRGNAKDDVVTTEDWLKTHFPDVFKGVHYCNHLPGGAANNARREKADICKENGIGVLVDDNPDIAIQCAEAGIQVFLFDQPWNRDANASNITRVRSWDEIVKALS